MHSPYDGLFIAAGEAHNVSPTLLAAVAKQESGFNPLAVSPAMAQGLMQLMPGTATTLHVDPNDPPQAIDGAARMLRGLLDKYNGSIPLALAGYNAGDNAVQKYGGVPPFKETHKYIASIEAMTNRGK